MSLLGLLNKYFLLVSGDPAVGIGHAENTKHSTDSISCAQKDNPEQLKVKLEELERARTQERSSKLRDEAEEARELGRSSSSKVLR